LSSFFLFIFFIRFYKLNPNLFDTLTATTLISDAILSFRNHHGEE